MGANVPTIRNSRSGVVVRHKEYLGDITASNVFRNQVFPINPGISLTFPWLSQIANSFEEYELRGMVFEFKSLSSDALLLTANNSSLGSVIMGTQYDVLDKPFVNKIQMENHQYSNSAKPSQTFIHPIECARKQTPLTRLFTRNAAVPEGADPRLYDLGNFQLAVQGMQGASTGTCGELWISYEVKFFKPQLYEYLGIQQLFDRYDSPVQTAGPPSLATTPFGDISTLLPIKPDNIETMVGSNLGTTITAGRTSGNCTIVVTFPPYIQSGVYKVQYFDIGNEANTFGHFDIPDRPGDPGIIPYNCRQVSGKYCPSSIDGTGFVDFNAPETGVAVQQVYYETYIELTGPFSIPAAGDATARQQASFALRFVGTTGTNDLPASGHATLLITQVSPHEANIDTV